MLGKLTDDKQKQEETKTEDNNDNDSDNNIENNNERLPNNFSLIDLSENMDDILKKYPKFENALKYKMVVTLNEGDMLYLPAGWFHEVTSKSNEKLKSHLALSYWMHVPIKHGTFKQPYIDNYWKNKNCDILKRINTNADTDTNANTTKQ